MKFQKKEKKSFRDVHIESVIEKLIVINKKLILQVKPVLYWKTGRWLAQAENLAVFYKR